MAGGSHLASWIDDKTTVIFDCARTVLKQCLEIADSIETGFTQYSNSTSKNDKKVIKQYSNNMLLFSYSFKKGFITVQILFEYGFAIVQTLFKYVFICFATVLLIFKQKNELQNSPSQSPGANDTGILQRSVRGVEGLLRLHVLTEGKTLRKGSADIECPHQANTCRWVRFVQSTETHSMDL